MHLNALLLFQQYAVEHFRDGQKVLEIGPDDVADSTFLRSVQDRVKVEWWFGDRMNFAVNHPRHVRFRSDYEIDCPDETFDVVYHGNVIEHVPRVWAWLQECARVLKPGGKMIAICPISWPYHPDVHGPLGRDCWRIYPEGMKALFADAGLRCDLAVFQSLDNEATDTIAVGTKTAGSPRQPASVNSTAGRITILTPTLNRPPATVERCLRSVNEQTFSGWEHLICSDGRHEPEVEEMVRRGGDRRRRYLHLAQAAGHFGAGVRAALLPEVRTDYVAFLDDDNILFPRFCERMVQDLDSHPEAGFAICQIVHCGPLAAHFSLPPVVLTGVPPRIKNIDTLQVVARTEAMRACGWVLDGYVSDGATYERLAQTCPWIAVDEVLGMHV
jgi:SAM-dependent methyltransferase